MTDRQKIDVYIDYATIPSLIYFSHFFNQKHDPRKIVLFGLSRFELPTHIIKSHSNLHFYPIQNFNIQALLNHLKQILSQENQEFEIHFHLNLFHSVGTIIDIYYAIRTNLPKIKHWQFYLYDDGAEGIANHYHLQNHSNLTQELEQSCLHLKHFLTHFSGQVLHNDVVRYVWNEILPTRYYFLSDHFLKKENLQALTQKIQHYEVINPQIFQQIPAHLPIIKDICQISHAVDELIESLKHQKAFLFIGTTIYDNEEANQNLYVLHHHLIRAHLQADHPLYIGEDVVFVFKGHPNSAMMNEKLKADFPNIICLPENIPLTIILMMGFQPEMSGGFASTSHLNIDQNKIRQLFFLTSTDQAIRNSKAHVYQKQFDFAQALLEMNCLRANQVCYVHLS